MVAFIVLIFSIQLLVSNTYKIRISQFSKVCRDRNSFKSCIYSEISTIQSNKNRYISRKKTSTSLVTSTIYPIFEEALISNILQAVLLKIVGQKSLTNEGLVHATILGVGLWTFLGWKGWLVCVSYLVLGSVATKIKMAEKEKLGIAEKRGGARGPENVWGSAATAMTCALLTYLVPEHDALWRIGYIASLATKLSDTFGSELGKAFGKTTYLITTLKRVPKGTEGAVSVEGTLAGVIGSLLIAIIGRSLGIIADDKSISICLFAAFVATNIESLIGADKISWLNNELVNLIMTVIGAVIAIVTATVVL